MTFEELKVQAAKLPPADQLALAEWIEQNEDIRDLRRTALVREIRIGLDELSRGECIECADDAALGAFFDGADASGFRRKNRDRHARLSRGVAFAPGPA